MAVPPHIDSALTAASVDVEAAERRITFLYQATSTLLATPLNVAARLLRLSQLSVPDLADWCLVDLKDAEDGLHCVAAGHWNPLYDTQAASLEQEPAQAPDDPWRQEVLRTRQSFLTDDCLRHLSPDVSAPPAGSRRQLLRQLGARSLLVVPLKGSQGLFGMVSFIFAESNRQYGYDDISLAEDLCSRASLAIENARLLAAEQEARAQAERNAARLARMQALTAGLAAALTPREVGQRLVQAGFEETSARAGALYVPDVSGQQVLCAFAEGVWPDTIALGNPADDRAETCIAQALVSGKPAWRDTTPGTGGLGALPLRADGTVAGVLALRFDEALVIAREQREFIQTLVQQGAVALERARLYEAERRARQSEAEARTLLDIIFDNAPVGFGFWDREHRYARVNPAMASAYGVPPQALLGQSIFELSPGMSPLVRESFDRVLQQGETITDLEIQGLENTTSARRWWRVNYYPVRRHGEIVGVGGIIQEITAQKRSEEERLQLLQQLEKAVQARDDFLSVASHELRTPLTALQLQLSGMMRSVVRGRVQLTRELFEERVGRALTQTDRLSRFIGEMLDVSRLRAGRLKLEVEPQDFAVIVRELIPTFEEELKGYGCTLEQHIPASIPGLWDRLRIEQVVTNLLTNAMKYGRGKPILLTVDEPPDDRVRLRVRDFGIGIAPGDHERVFNQFERAVSGKSFAGVGVGLWIVKRLVTMMGGTITVDSQLGAGATFEVVLPRHPPGEA